MIIYYLRTHSHKRNTNLQKTHTRQIGQKIHTSKQVTFSSIWKFYLLQTRKNASKKQSIKLQGD